MLIARPEDSYRMWCVALCDVQIARMKRPGQRRAAAPQRGKI